MSGKVRKRKGNTTKLRERTSNASQKSKNSAQSFGCFTKCLITFISLIGVLGLVAVIGYCRSPFTAIATTDLSKKVEFEGKFKLNKKLVPSVKISGLSGPESIEEDNSGNLYSGLEDGRIVRIARSSSGIIGKGKITNITSGVMQNIALSATTAAHGRPLGIRLLGDTLFVADAFYGLYSVNINSKEVTKLVPPDSVDPPLGFTDDLCLSKDGKFIYFSDMSSKYSYHDIPQLLMEGICDGRVMQYNLKSKETRTVMKGLCLANGVQLSDDEKILFVAESSKYRVRVVDTATWKTIKIVNVPVSADNIRPTRKQTYLIAGSKSWSEKHGFLERNPIVRQIIGGLIPEQILFGALFNNYNVAVEINGDGEIIQSLQDPTAELPLTQATVLSDGRLALGSYLGNMLMIADIKLD